tara:strand:- start:73 stop:363 length:291 start_codon:yes stop_codon:yes gene_type:complete
MVKIRKLTSEEENLCLKQRNKIEKQIDHLEIERKYYEWMLYEGGLRKNFEQKEMELMSQLRETERILSEARFKVTTLESQLRDGVEQINKLKSQTG